MSAPGIYRVSIRCAHDTTWAQRRKWSYSFFYESGSSEQAANVFSLTWTEFLRNGHSETVFAYEVFATSVTAGDDLFTTLPIPEGQSRGAVPINGRGEQYLPKAVLSLPLTVPNSRPSRKYARPGFYETDIINGVAVAPSFLFTIRSAWADALEDLAGSLVDPDGQLITGLGVGRLTTREFGRTAGNDVPTPPPLG